MAFRFLCALDLDPRDEAAGLLGSVTSTLANGNSRGDTHAAMDHSGHPPQTTPAEDAAIAKREVARGDLAHAMHHIAWALAAEPERVEWLGVLDAILEKSDDPLTLTEPGPAETPFAVAAARAATFARLGQYTAAVALLLEACAVKIEVPYVAWAVRWTSSPGVAIGIAADELERSFSALLLAFTKRNVSLADDVDAVRANAEGALSVLSVVREHHPRNEQLAFVAASLLRRLGRPEDARRLAVHAYETAPAWRAAIQVAMAEASVGNLASAIAWYERGLVHDPDDVSCHLEIADLLANNGRYGAARARYDGVLARAAHHPWAEPSSLAMTVRTTSDPSARAALDRLASNGNERARFLCAWLDRATPYLHFLPDPTDATLAALDQAGALADPIVKMTLSHLEAPSTRLAFEAQMATWGKPARLNLTVDKVPSPDPRIARRAVPFVLWQFDGTDATPAVAPPSERVSAAIAELAGGDYDLARWDEAAMTLASSLQLHAREVVPALVHWPRAPRADMPVPRWVVHVQVASALVASHATGGVDAIHAVIDGPVDWTTVAAIVALTRVAIRAPERERSRVEETFYRLFAARPDGGGCCFAHALYSCWLLLPGISAKDRSSLARQLAAVEEWDDATLHDRTPSPRGAATAC